MPIWRTLPVDDEPIITLRKWTVFGALSPGGDEIDHHFNGYHDAGREGRVSSKIVIFDPQTKVGVTKSGRKYQLLDGPGYNADASYVFDQWVQINNVDRAEVSDVTAEYLPTEEKGQ
jgi:hypothetical protein